MTPIERLITLAVSLLFLALAGTFAYTITNAVILKPAAYTPSWVEGVALVSMLVNGFCGTVAIAVRDIYKICKGI